jgi:hypothetical protein
MPGIIDPTAPTPSCVLLGPDGSVISETTKVIRARMIRLDEDGNPDGPGVEVPVRTMTVRRPPASASPCVPMNTALRTYTGTLTLYPRIPAAARSGTILG